jgi:prepilin-type N-terminal cleavage/methylation domain-containing protein
MKRRAFTLIELLVVIAIIAVLLSILLPSLGKSRLAARQSISLSNQRQILAATLVYRNDFNGSPPFLLTYQRGGFKSATSGNLVGICTWAYGGKNNDPWWPKSGFLKGFDVEAADRPLNPYMYPDITPYAPKAPEKLATDAVDRSNLQMTGYRDPTDKVTYQRTWPNPVFNVSSYDDVGTSYHSNLKWLYTQEIDGLWSGGKSVDAWKAGMRYFRLGDTFYSSRFVLYNDQYADIVINNDNINFTAVNGYGDINKSILGFMDGHAAYLTIFPGGPERPEAFFNDKYQMIFDPRTIKK